MAKRIVIIGTGGLARTAYEIMEDVNSLSKRFDCVGFLDQNDQHHGAVVCGLKVLGGLDWLSTQPRIGVVVGVGDPMARQSLVEQARLAGVQDFPSLIHPTAVISPRSNIGQGAIVKPFCVIQVNADVGEFLSMSSYSTFSHDTRIGNYVSTGPHVCVVGGGRVGDLCQLGAGAVILNEGSVGERCIVGANSTVIQATLPGSTCVGSPARTIARPDRRGL